MRLLQNPKRIGSSGISSGRQRGKDRRKTHHAPASMTPMKFVGIDGEGVNLPNGEHRYVLLGIGNDQIENANGLSWKDCFTFLYDHFETGTAFVGFYLGYDFTQIFRSLPEHRAHILFTQEGKALRRHRIKGKPPFPVEYEGWQFDLLGMKRLRIRPKLCQCRE